MGIAYLIYLGIAVLIYKIIRKFIKNKIILKLVIAFSILIPTYDIIIGNALKFYYCKFTDMEKINKQRERPEVVFYQKEEPFSKYETYTFNGFGIRKGEGIIGTEGDTSYIHNFHLGIDFVSGIGSIIEN